MKFGDVDYSRRAGVIYPDEVEDDEICDESDESECDESDQDEEEHYNEHENFASDFVPGKEQEGCIDENGTSTYRQIDFSYKNMGYIELPRYLEILASIRAEEEKAPVDSVE